MLAKTIPVLTLSILCFAAVSVFSTLGFNLISQEGDAGLITASLQKEGDTGF